MATATSQHPLATARPLADRVIIRCAKAPTHVGAILLPDSLQQQTKPKRGEVIAVGPGRRVMTGAGYDPLLGNDGSQRAPMDVEVGDTVLFSRFAGTSYDDGFEQQQDDDEYLILREDDILAKL